MLRLLASGALWGAPKAICLQCSYPLAELDEPSPQPTPNSPVKAREALTTISRPAGGCWCGLSPPSAPPVVVRMSRPEAAAAAALRGFGFVSVRPSVPPHASKPDHCAFVPSKAPLSSHCEEKRHGISCGSSPAAHSQVWGVPKAICLQCSDPNFFLVMVTPLSVRLHHLEGCTVGPAVSLFPVLTQLLASGRLERSTPPKSGQLACQTCIYMSEC